MQEIAPDVERYLDRVVSALRDDLGPDLIGAYLHGSLAMGAFTPGRSDIDMLAVCAAPLAPERSTALGEVLDAIPRPTSGGQLEFSLITEAAARTPSAAPAFEVHVSTHDEPSVVDGHDRPGDEDLVTHFAMAGARGKSLFGPDPVEMFPEPDRALLISAMRGDIEWARSSGAAGWEGHDQPRAASMTYQVLNGARCLRFLETGDLGSKAEGAEWLERRDPDPDVHGLLDAALVYQRGGTPDRTDARALDAFMERVEKALRAPEHDGRTHPLGGTGLSYNQRSLGRESVMAFDIHLPRTPPQDSSVVSWAFWVVRAEAAVACSLAADTASVVSSLARAAADAFAGAKPRD